MIKTLLAIAACMSCGTLLGAYQFDVDSFLGMVNGNDEIMIPIDVPELSIVVLGTNVSDWRKEHLWIEVELSDDGSFKKYLGDDLLKGNGVIPLRNGFHAGDELEMKIDFGWNSHDVQVGALTREGSKFEGLKQSRWPSFNDEYQVDGYFRNYFRDGSYVDWTIDQIGVELEPEKPRAPSGQPLPGSLVTLAIALACVKVISLRGKSHGGVEDDCEH